jgi:hypothetical protein
MVSLLQSSFITHSTQSSTCSAVVCKATSAHAVLPIIMQLLLLLFVGVLKGQVLIDFQAEMTPKWFTAANGTLADLKLVYDRWNEAISPKVMMVDLKEEKTARTALSIAAVKAKLDMVKWLLAKGAKVSQVTLIRSHHSLS